VQKRSADSATKVVESSARVALASANDDKKVTNKDAGAHKNKSLTDIEEIDGKGHLPNNPEDKIVDHKNKSKADNGNPSLPATNQAVSISKKDLPSTAHKQLAPHSPPFSRQHLPATATADRLAILHGQLSSLEHKVAAIRDGRVKHSTDVADRQRAINDALLAVVGRRGDDGGSVDGVVKSQVDHEPNSLTKENLLLRQENERLRMELLGKHKEIELYQLEIKQLRKARDNGIDRIGELSRIIESNQAISDAVYRKDKHRSYEADNQIREHRVG
jgi:Zn-finger nucleic acid-binding protein